MAMSIFRHWNLECYPNRGFHPGALGNVQNPKRLCNYDAKETPRNAKAVSRCIRRAGEASADSGSLSDKRNGATSWRHSGHVHQI